MMIQSDNFFSGGMKPPTSLFFVELSIPTQGEDESAGGLKFQVNQVFASQDFH